MEFLQIIGIICMLLLFVYLATKMLKFQRTYLEGFGNAGSSEDFSKEIKAKFTKLQDQLLVSKYRSEYETIILHMDDYINTLMLDTLLQTDIHKDPISSFEKINTLQSTKQSLNSIMKFVDST